MLTHTASPVFHCRNVLFCNTKMSLGYKVTIWSILLNLVVPVSPCTFKYEVTHLADCNAPINVKPQGGGAGYPREFDIVGLYLGQDFDNFFVPQGGKFDLAAILENWREPGVRFRPLKSGPRGRNLILNGDPRVGKLTFEKLKMSNSPGVARPPPPPWGLTLIGA